VTRIYTDAALTELCRTSTQRVTQALEKAPVVAVELVRELAATMRVSCAAYQDWLALTDEYVFEVLGHEAHARFTGPERIAELALRSGFTLETLVNTAPLLSGNSSAYEQQTLELVKAGKREEALHAWLECEGLFTAIRDLRRDVVSDQLGLIYADFGAEKLQEALLYAAKRGWWSRSMPADFAVSCAERLHRLIYFLTVGMGFEMRVEEHDDRWTVHVLVCGSCGRQLRDRYDQQGWGLRIVEGPAPLTHGHSALTIYQTHLAVIHHMFAIELLGAPWPAFGCAGLDAGSRPCELHVFKNPASTPTAFYELVGMAKPAA
jgi:hypothetical protein